jgi:hypothetical protein
MGKLGDPSHVPVIREILDNTTDDFIKIGCIEALGSDGDLCATAFFHPGHVGIYVGENKIIHALGWDVLWGEVVKTPLIATSGSSWL